MNQRFVTATVFLTAAVYAGFAVWLGTQPTALLTAFDIEQTTPQMQTEIRAFYGGIEMALAVAMIWLWKRGDLFAACLMGGLPLVGSVSGRLLGQLLDGYSPLHLGLAIPESIGATFCLIACWHVARHRRQGQGNRMMYLNES